MSANKSVSNSTIGFMDNILKIPTGVGELVKVKIFDEYGQVVFVTLIVLLIILIAILYKYTFETFNKTVLSTLNYDKVLKLKALPPCSSIPPEYQYRLCDYFIASSYNTPNIGKTQLDYVSSDMISKALVSGARFIQLPICAYSVDEASYPVICQSIAGKQQITSLNTIETRDALSAIRDFAFKYVDNKVDQSIYATINYPLIIQLKLHTTNEVVLDMLYADIKAILGKYLLPASYYKSYPVQLEKLCNLLNKIIIISTPGYEISKLNDIIIPTTILFQKLNTSQLAIPELTDKTINKYYQSLSIAKQRASYKMADNIAPYLKDVLAAGKAKDLETSILNNENLTEKLTLFNMVGMTIVEPDIDNSSASANYNPIMPFTYGCQFVAMNYQTPDEYMSLYINIFKTSSFVLKPSGLRLPIVETEIKDLLDDYNTAAILTSKYKANINPVFLSKYAEQLITLTEVASYQNKVISPKSANRLELVNADPAPNINYTFIVKPSPLTNDLIMLVSAVNTNLAITTIISSGDQLEVVLDTVNDLDMAKLGTQSFYPDNGLKQMSSTSNTISLRLYQYPSLQSPGAGTSPTTTSNTTSSKKPATTSIYYLGVKSNRVIVLPSIEDKALITFKYNPVRSIQTMTIENMLYGSVRVYPGGLVGLSKAEDSASKFRVINIKGASAPSATSQVIALLDIKTDKHLIARLGVLSCNKKVLDIASEPTAHFILSSMPDDNFTLTDSNGNYLVAMPDGTIALKKEYAELSPAIKDDTGKILKAARISPGIGSGKFFKVSQSFSV